MDIQKALAQLDPANDDHWTSDGAPRVDVVSEITGDKSLKRKDITDAAPKFTRELSKPVAPPVDLTNVNVIDPEAVGEIIDPEAIGTVVDAIVPEQESLSEQEMLDWALGVTPDELLADRSLFKEIGVILERNINEDMAQIENLKKKIDMLQRRHADLVQFDLNTDPEPNSQVHHIRRQGEIRAEKAARTRGVLEGRGGVTPDDIRKALSVQSPLDTAMRARKAAPGTTRPARMPMKTAEE